MLLFGVTLSAFFSFAAFAVGRSALHDSRVPAGVIKMLAALACALIAAIGVDFSLQVARDHRHHDLIAHLCRDERWASMSQTTIRAEIDAIAQDAKLDVYADDALRIGPSPGAYLRASCRFEFAGNALAGPPRFLSYWR
jgi:hypothetical protein